MGESMRSCGRARPWVMRGPCMGHTRLRHVPLQPHVAVRASPPAAAARNPPTLLASTKAFRNRIPPKPVYVNPSILTTTPQTSPLLTPPQRPEYAVGYSNCVLTPNVAELGRIGAAVGVHLPGRMSDAWQVHAPSIAQGEADSRDGEGTRCQHGFTWVKLAGQVRWLNGDAGIQCLP